MSIHTATKAKDTPFITSIADSFSQVFGEDTRSQSRAALNDLENLPFPDSKNEFWKYTRIAKLVRNQFSFTAPENPAPHITAIEDLTATRLVFINGIFSAAHSDALPAGVTLNLTDTGNPYPDKFNALAQPKKRVLEALNTAFCPQAAEISVQENTSVDATIHIAHWTEDENSISQPRVIVNLGRGSKATVVQTFEGNSSSGFTNSLSESFVGENAHLNWIKIESESSNRFHHSADYVRVQNAGHFSILTTPSSGNWIRNNLNIKLEGSQAFARLNGLCLLHDNQHVDNNTFVDHAMPHCDSSELYKYVLADKSTGVFNGKVIVRPDAQKTNAFQQNSNLLLSDDAQIFAKPELEIYADDVKCSHGSTTGQMDEEAVFYLQSRAIGKSEAQKMLLGAFAGEVLESVEPEAIKTHLFKIFDCDAN